jgi:hypothetical protein
MKNKAAAETYHFEELDDHSREYLLRVRNKRGQGMPGVFVPQSNYLPGLGCFFGLAILAVATPVIAWQLMENEPLAVAMIETAGLLLGGWMVLAAFRIWAAKKSAGYAGHFVYADAETLWECNGAYVTATDIYELIEAQGTQNFNQGKYQNTAVTLRLRGGSRTLTVADEERSRRLLVFLNVIAWLRGGGDGKQGEDAYKKLPPALMGAIAREHAETGDMPKRFAAEEFDLDVDDVPVPKKEGRASSSILWYALIAAVAVGGVYGFKEVNVPLRDDKIWNMINDIELPDERPPVIRAYLNDPRNTRHRDEAKTMLKGIYETNVKRIERGDVFVGQGVPMGGPPPVLPQFQMPGQPPPVNNNRAEKGQLEGLAQILYALLDEKLPLISVRVKEAGGVAGDAGEREQAVYDKYTLGVMEGLGKELVLFCQAPPDANPLIDITYKLRASGPNLWQADFTVTYRTSPDGDPVKTARSTVVVSGQDSKAGMEQAAHQLAVKTAGERKQRLQRIEID